MADDQGRPQGKRAPPKADAGGREFAGDTGLAESTSGPRVTGPPVVRPPARPASPPRPPRDADSAPRRPDSSVAGSQYFSVGAANDDNNPRELPVFGRERDVDSDADELAVDEDLGALTRRKERERASQFVARQPAAPAPHDSSSSSHKDLDAEAGARELDVGSPDIVRRRRRGGNR